jgi:hypothetical protein
MDGGHVVVLTVPQLLSVAARAAMLGSLCYSADSMFCL